MRESERECVREREGVCVCVREGEVVRDLYLSVKHIIVLFELAFKIDFDKISFSVPTMFFVLAMIRNFLKTNLI